MQRPFSQQNHLSGKQHWNDLCRPHLVLKEFFPSYVIACYKYSIWCMGHIALFSAAGLSVNRTGIQNA
jgi:hypothetical protein